MSEGSASAFKALCQQVAFVSQALMSIPEGSIGRSADCNGQYLSSAPCGTTCYGYGAAHLYSSS